MKSEYQTEIEAAELLSTLPEKASDIVKPWAKRSPHHRALVENGGAWTYAQLSTAITTAQEWLAELGVRSGDRLMMVCENCRAFVAVLLAAAELDAWPVLVNARLSAREVDEIRGHSGARRVIYTTSVSPHARAHADRHAAATADVANLGMLGVSSLNETTEPEPIDPVAGNRVAALIYTSGTTAQPKGVMLTHRNVLYLAAGSARIRSLVPEDRFYGVLPMSHAVGLSVVLLGSLFSGCTLYLAPRFDPVAALKAIERNLLTVLLGAPAMYSLLIEYANLKGLKVFRFPNLRIIASAGAPLQPALKANVEVLFGMALHNGYGVTECSPTIAQTRVEAPRSDTSVGPVFPGVKVRLVDRDSQPVAEGEVGELSVSGPNVMKGYYRAAQETAAAISADGWFNTRDLAQIKDANLFIVGRTKELIVRFGFNVYPAEIEAVLNAHPNVARSAVIGRQAKEAVGDEEVLAFVEPSPGTAITKDDLVQYAAQHLAPYKRPTQIHLVTALPLTLTGKVIKSELQNLAATISPSL